MKMKVSGLEGVELKGNIARLHESAGYLILDIRLSSPVGWRATATLTHKDLWDFVKLLMRPSNLRYVLFGFGKPGGNG